MKNAIAFLIIFAGGITLGNWLALSSTPIKKVDAVNLSVVTGNIGPKLVELGVIDPGKFQSRYLNYDWQSMRVDENNSKEVLNFFWAFGLANNNEVLKKGPMMDPKYGNPENFASVGGWTLGMGHPMEHYAQHNIVTLDDKEQNKVNEVAKKIFRPCCQNSAYFPDCNHGMAMLGALELMAIQGMGEEKMEKYANELNSLWFPEYRRDSSCSA